MSPPSPQWGTKDEKRRTKNERRKRKLGARASRPHLDFHHPQPLHTERLGVSCLSMEKPGAGFNSSLFLFFPHVGIFYTFLKKYWKSCIHIRKKP